MIDPDPTAFTEPDPWAVNAARFPEVNPPVMIGEPLDESETAPKVPEVSDA